MRRILFQYWIHQYGRPEHELVPNVPGPRINAPVHDQRPLYGVILIGHSPRQRVNVWHQAVAQLVVVEKDGLNFVVGPKLIVSTMTVGAEYGAEYSEFKPAGVKLLVHGVIGRPVIRLPIPSNIGCPIGVAGKREVQTGCHLMAQSPVGAVNIAGPDGRPYALLAYKSG